MRGCGRGLPVERVVGDPVDQRDGLVVEGDHAFGVELAERDLEPCAVATNLVDAVELEVEQLADA